MLSDITYFPIYGKPLVFYLGITTLSLFIITALIGLMIFRGARIPFKFHPTMAATALTFAVIHGILAIATGRTPIIILGIITISLFFITGLIGFMIFRGKSIPFKYHPVMASTAIFIMIIHGSLGISIYLS
ncbi:hypothetical protein [Methanobacterium sp.]|uniref:hypothetical protein n=1 Tax=Methanobacterium sp. TaxID=2164 RepID=UPI003C735715